LPEGPHSAILNNMIAKIKHVRDYRAFKGWVWPTDLPLFRQVNLVYGINGAGKSTLASLLQQAALDSAWSSGLEMDVTNGNDSSRTVNSASDTLWHDLRVFNKDYVEANLQFEEQSGSAAVPLLVLGTQRVEAEMERTRIQKRLAEIAEQLPPLRKKQKGIKKSFESLATNRARLIVQEIGSVGGRYEPRSYNAAKVRQVIKSGIAASSTQVEITKELSLARSASKPEINELTVTQFSIAEIAKATKDVLAESAVSNALSDLEDTHRSRWVQEGIGLHENQDTCIFCANDISSERRKALAEHFDTSLVHLQKRIESLLRELEDKCNAAQQAIKDLPRSGDLFEVHQEAYEASVKEARSHLKKLLATADLLAPIIRKKRESLFRSYSEDIVSDNIELSLADVGRIIKQHNTTAEDFDKQRSEAAKHVENIRIAEIADEYRELEGQYTSCNTRITEMEDENIKLRKELGNLDESNLDAEPIAMQLNDDLAHLLGRSDLTFEIEGQGYRITREGVPARHLSEGERNAISLLYFLRSLETHQTKSSDCIVVIDDPVSSLDGSVLVGASTHLWTRLVGAAKCRQLFLLTHNFELFRMWSSHLEHYPKSRDFKLTYGIYEIRTGARKSDNGKYRRTPIILSWPDDPRVQARLRSEYHYLFWRASSALRDCVLNPSAQGDVEAATVLPNVCRRLLEGFLGFKYPALLGNLHAQIMKASEGIVSEAMRARVLRFAHAYSHNQEADTTMPIARPEAVEMLHVVLEFMKIIDQNHFDAMCEAVGVDDSFLMQAAAKS
jgi:wobble nucleotide-excising tRNase